MASRSTSPRTSRCCELAQLRQVVLNNFIVTASVGELSTGSGARGTAVGLIAAMASASVPEQRNGRTCLNLLHEAGSQRVLITAAAKLDRMHHRLCHTIRQTLIAEKNSFADPSFLRALNTKAGGSARTSQVVIPALLFASLVTCSKDRRTMSSTSL